LKSASSACMSLQHGLVLSPEDGLPLEQTKTILAKKRRLSRLKD